MSVAKDPSSKTWTVQVWYKDYTGKRKHTTKRGFATKKDAEKWERNFLTAAHPEKVTVGTIADAFMKHLDMCVELGTLRDTTVSHKKGVINNHILPYFKDTIAENITTNNINVWLTKLIKQKPVNSHSERMCSGTVKAIKNAFSQIFDYGITEYGLALNPVVRAQKIAFFSNDTREKWTAEQYSVFRDNLYHNNVRLVFDIIYYAGLRLGEVLSLTPNDIGKFYIEVVKTAINKTKLHEPKTKKSARTVQIPEGLYYAIDSYIATIPCLKPTDRIFDCSRDTVESSMQGAIKRLDLPRVSPHTLRHMYASNLYKLSGHDITVVSNQLGHANSKVTLQVYTDMIDGEDRKAVDKLNELFEPTPNATKEEIGLVKVKPLEETKNAP